MAHALAVLERMAEAGKIKFKRGYKRRETMPSKEPKQTIPAQHQTVLNFLRNHDMATFSVIHDGTGLHGNSLSPVLHALLKAEAIRKVPLPDVIPSTDKRQSRDGHAYTLTAKTP